ncbi:hypothetical protein B9T10_06615 [Wohlfahrtiimonas chitiniclastica]|uniref:magnesium transporter CorA family protein n=1 Tax=Wohlfahrtiimonas chitiniclastica TaxID=400946 RepID=UPI000B980A3D|nr:magnesium transporter CorA family protein [Wohlfahrtiimonas chitiniclastica]OYQ88961.1 hypothetical protein B9T10_06615 [Wohlfahrtiimonas chitiniclastica]
MTFMNHFSLVAPTIAEQHEMTERFNLPAYFMHEATDINARPKLEQEGGHQLLVIHLPYVDQQVTDSSMDVKYRTLPFSMILTGDTLITVCSEKTALSFDHRTHTANILGILHQTAVDYIQLTQQIEAEITAAEDELSRSYRNPELYRLLYLNESLLYMATALKQMRCMMRKLEKGLWLLHKEDHAIFMDASVELDQAYTITEINQLNANNVMDAYGNIIQNNVSHVVKLLTAVTIVLSIPTLIASIYGMNVPLPFQEADNAFYVLIAVMVLISLGVAGLFWRKHYF